MSNKIVLDQELDTPQILYPSKKKWILIGLIFAFLSFFALMMLMSEFLTKEEKPYLIFGFIVVLGLTIMSFLVTSKKRTYFKISQTGFESAFVFMKKSFLWKDIKGFGIHIILNGKPIIGFNVKDGYQDSSSFMKTTNGKMFDKMFHFRYQIQDNYGFESGEFLDHLNFLVRKFNGEN